MDIGRESEVVRYCILSQRLGSSRKMRMRMRMMKAAMTLLATVLPPSFMYLFRDHIVLVSFVETDDLIKCHLDRPMKVI